MVQYADQAPLPGHGQPERGETLGLGTVTAKRRLSLKSSEQDKKSSSGVRFFEMQKLRFVLVFLGELGTEILWESTRGYISLVNCFEKVVYTTAVW